MGDGSEGLEGEGMDFKSRSVGVAGGSMTFPPWLVKGGWAEYCPKRQPASSSRQGLPAASHGGRAARLRAARQSLLEQCRTIAGACFQAVSSHKPTKVKRVLIC